MRTRFIVILVLLGVLISAIPAPVFAQQDPAAKTENIPCSAWTITGGFDGVCILKSIAWILYAVLTIISGLLAWAATLINWIIDITLSPTIYTFPALRIGWTLTRDFTNLFFIFILLVIAIGTILQIESYGARRALPRLILTALLINFSFVIPQYIILTSNSVAAFFLPSTAQGLPTSDFSANFLSTMNPGKLFESVHGEVFFEERLDEIQVKLHEKASCALGQAWSRLASWCTNTPPTLSPKEAEMLKNDKKSIEAELLKIRGGLKNPLEVATGLVFGIVFAIAFITAAFFLFMALAIMLINRTIQLWILMMLAPLAFLFGILDKTRGYTTQWWEKLIKQATFPIVFLFLANLSARIGNELNESLRNPTPNTPPGFGIGHVFGYLVTFMLLLMSLTAAQKAGGEMGKLGTKVYAGAKKYAWGGAALAGRGAFLPARFAGRKASDAVFGEGGTAGAWAAKHITGEGAVGRFLRKPGVRTLAQPVRSGAYAILDRNKKAVEERKNIHKNKSIGQLKDDIMIAINPMDKAAILSLLAEKNDLKLPVSDELKELRKKAKDKTITPEEKARKEALERELKTRFSGDTVREGTKLLKGYGISTKEIESRAIQYATEEELNDPKRIQEIFAKTNPKALSEALLVEGGEAAESIANALRVLGSTMAGVSESLTLAGNPALARYLTSTAGREILKTAGISTETEKERVKRENEERKEVEEEAQREKQQAEERKQKEAAEQREQANAKIVSDILGPNKPA